MASRDQYYHVSGTAKDVNETLPVLRDYDSL